VVVSGVEVDRGWEGNSSAAGVVAVACTMHAPGSGPKVESSLEIEKGCVSTGHLNDSIQIGKEIRTMWWSKEKEKIKRMKERKAEDEK